MGFKNLTKRLLACCAFDLFRWSIPEMWRRVTRTRNPKQNSSSFRTDIQRKYVDLKEFDIYSDIIVPKILSNIYSSVTICTHVSMCVGVLVWKLIG